MGNLNVDDLYQTLLLQPQLSLLERGLSDKFQYRQAYLQYSCNPSNTNNGEQGLLDDWTEILQCVTGGFGVFWGGRVALLILNICS